MTGSRRSGGGRGSRLLWIALLGVALTALAILRGIGSGGESPGLAASASELEARPPPAQEAKELESAPSSREPILTVAPPAPPVNATPAAGSPSYPTGSLAVRLLAGDAPAESGVVQLYFTRNWRLRTQAIDKTTGIAFYPELPLGEYHVVIENPPYGWLLPRVLARHGPDNHLITQIHPGTNTCDVNLESPAHVVGTALDPDGQPVTSGSVQLVSVEDGSQRAPPSWLSITAGKFEGNMWGGVFSLDARRSRRSGEQDDPLADIEVVRVAAGQTTRVTLQFQPRGAAAISGRITDEQGNAFGGLVVQGDFVGTAREAETGKEFEVTAPLVCRTRSAVDGTFRLEELQPGRYQLVVERYGFQAFRGPRVGTVGYPTSPVEVLAFAGGEAHVDLRARRSHRAHVRGRVELAAEEPAKPAGGAPATALKLIAQVGPPGEQRQEMSLSSPALGFDFFVEAASPDPRIVLTLGDRSSTYPLEIPKDGELAPLVLHFPQ